ncbi:MAG: TIGR02530 family flagellar biosynthesis protein [Bacillota bacterium]|jgi:flagellar operon protein
MSEQFFVRPPQIGQTLPATCPRAKPGATGKAGVSFDAVLQNQLTAAHELKFSAHALKRLESRQIALNDRDLELLQDAVNRAEAKGAKEALIIMDQLALVVSVKNRTVITAMDDRSLRNSIFTNIDSAVIVRP